MAKDKTCPGCTAGVQEGVGGGTIRDLDGRLWHRDCALALLSVVGAGEPLVVVDVRGALTARLVKARKALDRWREAFEKKLRGLDLPAATVDALVAAGRPASKHGLALVHDGLFRDEAGGLLPYGEWAAQVVDGRIPKAALLEIEGFGASRHKALVAALGG